MTPVGLTTNLEKYLDSVDWLVSQEGCEFSDRFATIRRGWEAVNSFPQPTIDDISAAAIAGDVEATDAAISDYAVRSMVQPAMYRERVARSVLTELRSAYLETAQSNYEAVASRFDKSAARLMVAGAACALSMSAEAMVQQTAKQREAWTAGALAARELDDLLPVLTEAARLAGAVGRHTVQEKPDDFALALRVRSRGRSSAPGLGSVGVNRPSLRTLGRAGRTRRDDPGREPRRFRAVCTAPPDGDAPRAYQHGQRCLWAALRVVRS